jgi:hypothetical protein
MGSFKNKKLGVWGILVSGLTLLATVAANGVSSPVKETQKYDCTSSCFNNYRWCLTQGKSATFCATQYQTCMINCGAGGGIAGREAE